MTHISLRQLTGSLAFIFSSLPLFSNPLSPQTPVAITTNGTVTTPVAVSSTSDGYMSAWTSTDSSVQTSFSNDLGQSWATTEINPSSSLSYITVCSNGSVFLTGWISPAIGVLPEGTGYTSLSLNNGSTWQTPVEVSPAHDQPGGPTLPPLSLAANASGFMAVWSSFTLPTNSLPFGVLCNKLATSTYSAWSAFSSDGTTWNTAIEITSGLYPVNFNLVSLAGNAFGFLATWSADSTFQGFASFSDDNGATWGTPVEVATVMAEETQLSACGINNQFMAAWVTDEGIGFASFSNDNGATWGSPVRIASNLNSSFNITLSAIASGFIASWHGSDDNAYASFSSDHGSSWSTPVQITNDASLMLDANSYVGVSGDGTGCLFTWWDNTNNAQSSYSQISQDAPSSKSVSSFFEQVSPNNPGRKLF